MNQRTYQRRYDLDWLRVLAFTLLILFHTGMMFNNWNWHVKNPETSSLLEYVMAFLNQWRMPLLFFISGAAVWFAMEKYSTARFSLERIKRLLVPLVFGMFVIIPPQVYFERRFQGEQFSSLWEFYQTVLELHPYPEGNFSWHHLWYLPYILVFSFLMLPVFQFFKSDRGRQILRSGIERLSARSLYILGFVPIAISEVCLRPFWPDNAHNLVDDWAHFTSTLIIFCFGFALASSSRIWPRIERDRRRLLILGVVTMATIYLFRYGDFELPALGTEIYRIVRSANIWFWILTILGFGSRYLRRDSAFLRYSNQVVYPFYILHQTITVAVGYYLVDWDAGIPIKFLVLATATFLGSWLLYEFPIKRINFIRPLFGLKMLDRSSYRKTSDSLVRVAYSSQGSK
ncbi:MAG TPA: acyltransferase family protein [Acidobacteriota bacterium]|nr:acyltransferase family protein [Acidobacteriota bacterium]